MQTVPPHVTVSFEHLLYRIVKSASRMNELKQLNKNDVVILLIPRTSVASGVLAALLENQILYTRPKSVRGNWPLWSSVVSRVPSVASRGFPPFRYQNSKFKFGRGRGEVLNFESCQPSLFLWPTIIQTWPRQRPNLNFASFKYSFSTKVLKLTNRTRQRTKIELLILLAINISNTYIIILDVCT